MSKAASGSRTRKSTSPWFPCLPPSKSKAPKAKLIIEIGVLSGDRFSFKLGDQFLTDDDVSRHILDRLLFPKLVE